jgi:XapX domain-containing protein
MPLRELEALAVGVVVGFLFSRLRLPVPAPPEIAGILGIVGIWLGFRLSSLL